MKSRVSGKTARNLDMDIEEWLHKYAGTIIDALPSDGTPVTAADLSKTTGLTWPTVRRWISLLAYVKVRSPNIEFIDSRSGIRFIRRKTPKKEIIE